MARINGNEMLSVVRTLYVSETDYDLKARYNLGAYDSVETADGKTTITRQTGYLVINAENLTSVSTSGGSGVKVCQTNLNINGIYNVGDNQVSGKSNIGYDCLYQDNYWLPDKKICLKNGTDIYISDDSKSTVADFASLCPIYIEYQLATSYTEDVIENQPLNTLNQRGSQWLADEYNKTTNLLPSQDITSLVQLTGLKPNTEYAIRIDSDQTYTYSEGHWYVRDLSTSTTLKDGILTNQTYTFTTGADASNIRLYFWGTWKSGSYQTMLNVGSTALPYQAYNGDVIHKVDIEPVLLWSNGSPNASFAGQTITIKDMSNYKFIVIEYKNYYTGTQSSYIRKIRLVTDFNIIATSSNTNENLVISRGGYKVSNTSITFYDAYSNQVVDNDRLIPIAIYGTNVM